MKKAVFVQIPGTPVWPEDIFENVPYGAGALVSYLRKHIKKGDTDFIIPDYHKVNILGDEALIDYLTSLKPDILLFTVYLWNVERSLYIAEKIKEKLDLLVVFGGPEVYPDNQWLVEKDVVDYFVSGEGEIALFEFMSGNVGRERFISSPPTPSYLSPYLSSALDIKKGYPIYIDSQRGCSFKCAFCLYSKGSSNIRAMPLKDVKNVLRLARLRGAKDIIFVDPTFNLHPHFKSLLEVLVSENRDGFFRYHAELKPHLLKDDEISLINSAGFSDIEVGLQTVHAHTQRRLGCYVPLDKFGHALSRLSRKINIKLDLISCLPGEGIEELEESMSYVKRYFSYSDVYLYHLLALPGSRIRSMDGIDYEKVPPYLVIKNGAMDAGDLRKINNLFLEYFGEELDPFPDMYDLYKMRRNLNYIKFGKLHSNDATSNVKLFNLVEFESGMTVTHISDIVQRLTSSNPFSTFVFYIREGRRQDLLLDAIVSSSRLTLSQATNRMFTFTRASLANFRIGLISRRLSSPL